MFNRPMYDHSITAKLTIGGVVATWISSITAMNNITTNAILGIPLELIPIYATIISTGVAVVGVIGNLIINYLKFKKERNNEHE